MSALTGKSAIVTGAGRGLGRAYALAIGAEGAAVVVNDVDAGAAVATADAIRAGGGRATAVVGSVSDWSVARSLVTTCTVEFGRVDGLVNNAAITRHAPPWSDTEEDLRVVVEVNVLGVQFVARHAMEAMLDQGSGGSIVNVISGARSGIEGMSSYGASKGAVASMTLTWALEGRAHGIRVNAVSPLAETRMAAGDPRAGRPALPPPEQIAPLVVTLLSDASRSVTGALLRFDGQRLSHYDEALHEIALQPQGWSSAELVTALGAAGRGRSGDRPDQEAPADEGVDDE